MLRAPQSPQRYSTPRIAGRPVPGVTPAADGFVFIVMKSERCLLPLLEGEGSCGLAILVG